MRNGKRPGKLSECVFGLIQLRLEQPRQGHLELWDTNATRCVKRILPVFNRMSIFTVLDDAFHGHPEPSAAPPGVHRYALQAVYYTETAPLHRESNSTRHLRRSGGAVRSYPELHGAIFQVSGEPCLLRLETNNNSHHSTSADLSGS
jgi:hypothetical protein